MSRPSTLTPEVHASIVATLATGCTLREASVMAGREPDTVTKWYNRGRRAIRALANGDPIIEGHERYVQFVRAVDEARTRPTVFALGQVQRLMSARDPAVALRAATWYLGATGRMNPTLRIEAHVEVDVEDVDAKRARVLDLVDRLAERRRLYAIGSGDDRIDDAEVVGE